MIAKTVRRTAFATGAVAAAAATAVLVSSLSGGATATGAMPRVHMVAPASSLTGSSNVNTANATTSAATGSREFIQLAPYTTPIGAIVTARSSMEAYLTASLYDVHNTWSRLFKGWNYKAPTITFQFPVKGEVLNSCGPTNDMTFQYCITDDTLTISQEGARNLWLGSYGNYTIKGTDDMSVSVLVAHEYGHNVEAELGLWDGRTGAQKERGADCFAGVWAKDASDRGILDDGDINEGLQALDLLAEHPGQSDNGLHGTPEERKAAFTVGYSQGARACVTTYLTVS
jgi:predicted metalloprotease